MATYMIPCLLGLEKLVGDEVKRLGLKNVRVENGRIFCDGAPDDCARLNINLRCGARVLLVLGEFPARSFEELFQGVKAIPWENCLPSEGLLHYQPAPFCPCLPIHCEKGHGGAAEESVWPGAIP